MYRKVVAVVGAVVVASSFVPGASANAPEGRGPCEERGQVTDGYVKGVPVCTHYGADPVHPEHPHFVHTPEGPAFPRESSVGDSSSTDTSTSTGSYATCPDNASTGPHVELIYGVPSDRTQSSYRASYSAYLDPIRRMAGDVDSYLDWSAGPFRDQNIRWLCASGQVVVGGELTLRPVNTATDTDNDYSLSDVSNSLNDAGVYNRTDRKYIVMVDGLASGELRSGGTAAAGVATVPDDPNTTDPNANLSSGRGVAVVRLINTSTSVGATLMHELFHLLGAVQKCAPHSTGCSTTGEPGLGGHCWEEEDRMCNTAGGIWFDTGGTMKYFVCDTDGNYRLDCNKDDYYSTLCRINLSKCSTDANWLATHWNTANSVYLTAPTTNSAVVVCGNLGATMVGDEGKDSWTVSNTTNDVMQALEGNDPEVTGFGGDDYVCGEQGHDTVRGGPGGDRVYGGFGDDWVYGGTGYDNVNGGPADDRLYDGPGVDTIDGGDGYDILYQCADNESDTIVSGTVESVQAASSSYC